MIILTNLELCKPHHFGLCFCSTEEQSVKKKDLRKLNRSELLELMIDQEKELRQVRAELAEARLALESREISIQNAGSLAEAALELNHIFEDAQNAADQYLENIRQMELQARTVFEEQRRSADAAAAEEARYSDREKNSLRVSAMEDQQSGGRETDDLRPESGLREFTEPRSGGKTGRVGRHEAPQQRKRGIFSGNRRR